MYNYLPTVTADYTTTTLSVTPSRVMTEMGSFKQIPYEADDGSTNVVTLSSNPIFYVTLLWENKSETDADTIFDFYFDTTKAYGMARSFKWEHPLDGYTYVVKFASDLSRVYRAGLPNYMSIEGIKLRVLGVSS